MDFTIDDLLDFAIRHQGQKWETTAQKKPFTFRVEGETIFLKTSLKNERKVTRRDLETFCAEFKTKRSFRSNDYPAHWHKSYAIALVQGLIRELEQPRPSAFERSPEMILTAYFLAKYSRLPERVGQGYPPPEETGLATWEEVYRQLYPKLHGGREFERFKDSIYGSINGIGRKMLDSKPLDPKEAAAVRAWVDQPREALWGEVLQYFDAEPADTPRVVRLKAKLKQLHPLPVPPAPKALKKIRRVITAYERPSRTTRYVKRTRGTCCQLCEQEHFVKRNGQLYCEVHHIFQLSKNPPVECLSAEYLVAVCATCHRMLHYADTGEPERVEGGWKIRVGQVSRSFSTKPVPS